MCDRISYNRWGPVATLRLYNRTLQSEGEPHRSLVPFIGTHPNDEYWMFPPPSPSPPPPDDHSTELRNIVVLLGLDTYTRASARTHACKRHADSKEHCSHCARSAIRTHARTHAPTHPRTHARLRSLCALRRVHRHRRARGRSADGQSQDNAAPRTHMPIDLSVHMSVRMSVRTSVHVSMLMSVLMSMHMCMRMSVHVRHWTTRKASPTASRVECTCAHVHTHVHTHVCKGIGPCRRHCMSVMCLYPCL